jgi:hypothetical protein
MKKRIACIKFLGPAGDLLREETKGLRRQNRNQSKLKKFWHISNSPAKIGGLILKFRLGNTPRLEY